MRADQDRAPAFFERLIQMLFALEGHLFADHLGMIGEIHELDHAAAEIGKTGLDDLLLSVLGKAVAERDVDRFLGDLALGPDKYKSDGKNEFGQPSYNTIR